MRRTMFLAVAALCVTCGLFAAEGDFGMTIVPATSSIFGPAGGTASGSIDLEVQLDAAVVGVQGWSFGIKVEPSANFSMNITALRVSEDTMKSNNGSKPGFQDTAYFAAGDLQNPVLPKADQTTGIATITIADCVAVTQGIVIDMMQTVALPVVSDFGMINISLNASGPVGAAETQAGKIVFTDNIGNPATPTVVVFDGGSFTPAVKAEAVIKAVPRTCVGAAPFTVNIDDAAGFGEIQSLVRLNFNADGKITAPIQGWSYGVCILDKSKLTIVEAKTDGTDTATAKNGEKPDFDTITLYQNEGGVTHGVVVDMFATVTIPAETDWTDLALSFTLVTTTIGDTVVVAPCSGVLGAPATPNVMVIDGASLDASAFERPSDECCEGVVCNHLGTFTVAEDKKNFLPGNANGDRRLDIADGIFLLSYLFRSGRTPPCLAAADFNNDGLIDVTDAIAIVYYQLQPTSIPDTPPTGWPGPALGPCGKYKVDLACDVEQQCK